MVLLPFVGIVGEVHQPVVDMQVPLLVCCWSRTHVGTLVGDFYIYSVE